MTRWKVEMPWHRIGRNETVRFQKTVLEGRLGSPLLLKIGASKLDREIALQRIFEVYRRPIPWRILVDETSPSVSDATPLATFVAPFPLPINKFKSSCRDVLLLLSTLAKYSDTQTDNIISKLNNMGLSRAWSREWSRIDYRIQTAIQLGVYAERFKIVFLNIDDRKLRTDEERIQFFEMIRTVCGSFRVSILCLTNKRIAGFEFFNFLTGGEHVEVSNETEDGQLVA